MNRFGDAAPYLDDSAALMEGLRLGHVGVWRWLVGTDKLGWSPNLTAVHGLPESAFDGTIASFRRDVHPDDADRVFAAIQAAVASGEPYRCVYRTGLRDDGEPLWIEATAEMTVDAEGRHFLTGICMDVTERVRQDMLLKRQLDQQRAIAQFGSFALEEDDFAKVMDEAVAVAATALDAPLSSILKFSDSAEELVLTAGIGWRPGIVGAAAVNMAQGSQAGLTLSSLEPVVSDDLRTERRFTRSAILADHGAVSGMSVVIPGSARRPFGVFGIHTRAPRHFDQSDVEFLVSLANIVANGARHHAAGEQRSLLLREMAHRAGNMLQLVSTIASQTFTEERDAADARRSFSQRLASLSRANYLIARDGWRPTRFAALVEETLLPFRGRYSSEGRDILLPPELSFDLGLVLHELATNSAKYGTFGRPDGSVELGWRITGTGKGDVFRLSWRDPAPVAQPAAPGGGFGSRLLGALVERKWEGVVTLDTAQSYSFTADIPLAATTPGEAAAAAAAPSPASSGAS